MPKHTLMQLNVKSNPPEVVEAFTTYSPHFAVHRTLGAAQGWSVTHIPTGAKVGGYLPQRIAFKLAAAIGAMMDWSSADESVLAAHYRALPGEWQVWARGFGKGLL